MSGTPGWGGAEPTGARFPGLAKDDARRAANRRTLEEALTELGDLENVVNDALARLPALQARIILIRAKLAGLLPPEGGAGASSEAESDDPAQGQLTG